jgi:hypothetical protein
MLLPQQSTPPPITGASPRQTAVPASGLRAARR